MSYGEASNIVVKLSEEAGVKETMDLRVYVVNSAGAITEEASFDGLTATLKTTRVPSREKIKIYISQVVPKEAARTNEDTLTTMGAYNALLNFEKDNIILVKRLPDEILKPVLWHFCHVKGNLSKMFSIDGNSARYPVCHARVHICHAERIFFWPLYLRPKFKIPDWILHELRDKFVNLDISIPKIPTRPVFDQLVVKKPVLKQNLPLRSTDLQSRMQKRPLRKDLQPLPEQVLKDITSDSLQTVRQTLVDYHELLHPYLCLWPIFWPWFYWLSEETVVTSDCNGNFDAWLFQFNHTSRNIYIWVEVQINGQWVTVYRPSIPCNTRWNYQCGSDINVNITSTKVEPCDCDSDGPADAVWFRSVGDSASALHIEQNTGSSIALQGSSLGNGGCTDILYGQKISPFGDTLALKLFCGANIFDAGVTHYRWKKTRIANANQDPIPLILQTTEIIDGHIARPYLVKLSATHYETHTITLGVEGTGTEIAYRIPHQNITEETLIPLEDQGRDPQWSNVFFDSAVFDSTALTDGIYKFELELLKKEANGSFTNVPVAKSTFQVSEYAAIDHSQDAPDEYLKLTDAVNASFFKMNLRIDNEPCEANVHDAYLVQTDTSSGTCGFIKYGDTSHHVQISFEASHPRNFASFSFGVIKGNNTESTGISGSGYVLSSTADFTLTTIGFHKNVLVSQLLGDCPQAAFSENLYVAALATNGSARLNGYDRSDVNAFALSNS